MNDLNDVLDARDVKPGATAADASKLALAGFLLIGAVFALVVWKRYGR
jgi:hypothetical protein